VRWPCLLFLALVLWCAANADALAEKRVALVIGNSTYQHAPRLNNPLNDAVEIAKLMKDIGFEVDFRRNLGATELRRAIRQFRVHVRSADIAIVFYAGHGIELKGANYLVPTDAKLEQDVDVEDEAVSLQRLESAIAPAKRLGLIILDACRDNPFLATMERTLATRALRQGLAEVQPIATNILVAFAAKAGSIASDGEGPHSPFTTGLLKHLRTPGVDVRFLLGRVRDDVLASTNEAQEPFVYGSLGGSDVTLVPAPVVQEINSPDDTRRAYEATERVGTRKAWESFIAQHRNGFYAELARAQLAKLSNASTQSANDAGGAGSPKNAKLPSTTGQPALQQQTPLTLSRGELIYAIKNELKRVGCYPGKVDEIWVGTDMNRWIARFSSYSKFSGAVNEPNDAFLEALKRSQPGICPLECSPRQEEQNGRCVTKACPMGQELNPNGHCVDKITNLRQKRKPVTRVKHPNRARRGSKCFQHDGKVYC